jgi:hypothetical protein
MPFSWSPRPRVCFQAEIQSLCWECEEISTVRLHDRPLLCVPGWQKSTSKSLFVSCFRKLNTQLWFGPPGLAVFVHRQYLSVIILLSAKGFNTPDLEDACMLFEEIAYMPVSPRARLRRLPAAVSARLDRKPCPLDYLGSSLEGSAVAASPGCAIRLKMHRHQLPDQRQTRLSSQFRGHRSDVPLPIVGNPLRVTVGLPYRFLGDWCYSRSSDRRASTTRQIPCPVRSGVAWRLLMATRRASARRRTSASVAGWSTT